MKKTAREVIMQMTNEFIGLHPELKCKTGIAVTDHGFFMALQYSAMAIDFTVKACQEEYLLKKEKKDETPASN